MATNKRQHYLPKFYLNNFATEGMLWVYDKLKLEIRQQPPVHTCVESNYYTLKNPDATRNLEIERFFSGIEHKAHPIISKLDAQQTISKDEKSDIAIFTAFMLNRTPDFLDSVKQVESTILKDEVVRMVNSSSFSDKLRSDMVATDDLEAWNRTLKIYQEGCFNVSVAKDRPIEHMFGVSLKIAPIFAKMDWRIFHSSKETSFVTSDNPVVLMPPVNHPLHYGCGPLLGGVVKIFPLSQTSCLAIYDNGDSCSHFSICKKTVREINLFITSQIKSFLIAKDKKLLQTLVKRCKLSERPKRARFKLY